MKKLFLFIIVFVCAFLVGCNNSESSNKIKVGVLMPLTGDMAFLGQCFANAITMNADTSVIQLFIQDSKGEAKTAISVVNQMITRDRVDVVVSLMPSVSEAINPILESKNITHFVFTFSPEITDADNVIRQYPSTDEEDIETLNYAKEKGVKSITFMRHIFPDAELSFKNVVVPMAKQMGIKIIDEPFEESTKDFNNLSQKVKSYNSDLIVVQSLSYNYLNIVRSFYHAGISNKMLGDLNFNDLYTYDFNTVKEMDNIPFLGMTFVLSDAYKKYEIDYKGKYNDRPSVMSAFPYDVMTIINNLKVSGLKKDEIITYYKDNVINGITGRLVYDEKGNQIIDYIMLKYEDGIFIEQ